MRALDKYKPAATKAVLLSLAGGFWMLVGAMLLFHALSWLLEVPGIERYVFASAGVILALLVHHFGFLRIVDRNLARILPADGKRCLFSFMPWKSYLLIPVMVAAGAVLRHSAIPKKHVAVLYTGIGLALILSSFRYARVLLSVSRGRLPG